MEDVRGGTNLDFLLKFPSSLCDKNVVYAWAYLTFVVFTILQAFWEKGHGLIPC